jgi:hypothetical protein
MTFEQAYALIKSNPLVKEYSLVYQFVDGKYYLNIADVREVELTKEQYEILKEEVENA